MAGSLLFLELLAFSALGLGLRRAWFSIWKLLLPRFASLDITTIMSCLMRFPAHLIEKGGKSVRSRSFGTRQALDCFPDLTLTEVIVQQREVEGGDAEGVKVYGVSPLVRLANERDVKVVEGLLHF